MISWSKNKWKIIVLILLVFAIGGGIFWYFQTRDIILPIGEEEEISFHFRLAGNEVVGWSRGEMVWRIKVQTILDPERERSGEMGEKLILQDVEEGFFYREGEIFFTFTVEEAHYHTRSEDLNLFGFRMETPEGDWMETSEMVYTKTDDILRSPGKVIGKVGKTDIEAERMTVLLEEEEIIFEGGVKMIHQLEVE